MRMYLNYTNANLFPYLDFSSSTDFTFHNNNLKINSVNTILRYYLGNGFVDMGRSSFSRRHSLAGNAMVLVEAE